MRRAASSTWASLAMEPGPGPRVGVGVAEAVDLAGPDLQRPATPRRPARGCPAASGWPWCCDGPRHRRSWRGSGPRPSRHVCPSARCRPRRSIWSRTSTWAARTRRASRSTPVMNSLAPSASVGSIPVANRSSSAAWAPCQCAAPCLVERRRCHVLKPGLKGSDSLIARPLSMCLDSDRSDGLAGTGGGRYRRSMSPLRIGVLGAARIAPQAVIKPAAAHPDVVVAAVAARDPERARAFATKHTIPTVHTTYDDLVADPEIDAVYNPLPNGLHGRWTIAALEAGKTAPCEKPFTLQRRRGRRWRRLPKLTPTRW